MRLNFLTIFFLSLLYFSSGFTNEDLIRDLQILEKIQVEQTDSLPLTWNHLLQTGYFTMPSARMGISGDVALGYSFAPPYRIYNLHLQYFDRVSFSGNYWVFHKYLEANFGAKGYGDDADRAANIKVSLIKKEDDLLFLPEMAIGINDFIGSRRFHSVYIVGTKQFLGSNLEVSLGWGKGRINGFFAGCSFSPFRHSETLLKHLTFAFEYDANDYKHHTSEHPKGRKVKFPINMGVHYQYNDWLYMNMSSLRGEKLAASLSLRYHFGKTKGLVPKTKDPKMYSFPSDTEPLDLCRTKQIFSHQLGFAFQKQKLSIQSIKLSENSLWIKILNCRYRKEENVKLRILHVLASLVPSNIDKITAVVEEDGIEQRQYTFRSSDLIKWSEKEMGLYELDTLSVAKDYQHSPEDSQILFHKNKKCLSWIIRPEVITYFGSTKGKLKYDLGLILGPYGYLWDQIFYDLRLSYIMRSSRSDLHGKDVLNPSKLIQVRSDMLKYNRSVSLHVDTAYLQRSWNLHKGLFARVSMGYFEIAYGGIASELLLSPIDSSWGLGLEVATLWKRKYFGMGFFQKIDRFNGSFIEKIPYIGLQYFFDIYAKIKPLSLDVKISLGQFLAKDKGVRFEVIRKFESGFNVSLWYTFTNGNDHVNNELYFDKGICFSIPFDFFLNHSSRSKLRYSSSAWLRDVGARAKTGKTLYSSIIENDQ